MARCRDRVRDWLPAVATVNKQGGGLQMVVKGGCPAQPLLIPPERAAHKAQLHNAPRKLPSPKIGPVAPLKPAVAHLAHQTDSPHRSSTFVVTEHQCETSLPCFSIVIVLFYCHRGSLLASGIITSFLFRCCYFEPLPLNAGSKRL